MPVPSVVLFDLGNVLVNIDPDAFWVSLGLCECSARTPFVEGYEQVTRSYETGLITTEIFLENLRALFTNRFLKNQLQHAFENVITNPIDGMVDIVKGLSQTRRTGLVSNTNELHYSLSYARLESLHVLHQNFLSYRLNVMKPDAGFYAAILKGIEVDPAEMVFIDDLEPNVEGARLAGMQAIRFEGVEQLRLKLNQMGIL